MFELSKPTYNHYSIFSTQPLESELDNDYGEED